MRFSRSLPLLAVAVAIVTATAPVTLGHAQPPTTGGRPAPAAATAAATAAPAPARTKRVDPATKAQVVLHPGDTYETTFTSAGGQGVIDLTAWAPGTDWQVEGDESATASIYLDGEYATDLLVPGATKLARQLQLGDLTAGRHSLRFSFNASHSAPRAAVIALAAISASTVAAGDPGYVALAHSPILYGRSLAAYGGPMQNSWTDAPLVAWHYSTPNPDGTTSLEYQIVWSNEDGGTDTEPPSEQARWGRMTDIEWIYRVTVDAQGNTVPNSETFQAPAHVTSTFTGVHEGDHPVLQTCTDNNNVCDTVTNASMRFFLSTVPTMNAATQAREQIMDMFPWTYAIMGKEMIREHHTEAKGNPATAELSDARNYLYVVIRKTTSNPTGNASSPWVGVSVGVKLKGDKTVYRSDHDIPAYSLQRDGLDATDVELPPGTTVSDIQRIDVIRFPTSVRADPGYSATVSAMTRAYLLDRKYQPITPFLTWSGTIILTKEHPTATVWQR
ncbi:MAG: hypothetical protein ACR2I1_00015 [Propionibacteriaceae bacterium]